MAVDVNHVFEMETLPTIVLVIGYLTWYLGDTMCSYGGGGGATVHTLGIQYRAISDIRTRRVDV